MESTKHLPLLTFFLLVMFLPSQLGLHFWPHWSYISGIRIDYFSPTLYLTDILVLTLFLLWAKETAFRRKNYGKYLLLYCFIGLLVLLNVKFSLSPFVSLYKWVKIAEFGFLAWWISRPPKTIIHNTLYIILLVPIFYESILAVWQFFSQSSIGGLWYFLGERTFNGATPGIANAYINGELWLRPYATFPHPNVLGGFLAVVLPLVLWDFLHNSRKLLAPSLLGYCFIALLGYSTLFLSVSRAAILVGIGATLLVLWQKLRAKTLGILGVLGIVGTLIMPRFLALRTETEPFLAREQLNSRAIEQFAHSPVWGTGLGTAPMYTATRNQQLETSNYALAFQPPHNIYLLVLAETGPFGLLLFLYLIIKTLRHLLLITNCSPASPAGGLLIALASVLALGLFDHYFLTLQQGQLLFALLFGLSWGLGKTKLPPYN